MRSDITPGGVLPDYSLPDHTSAVFERALDGLLAAARIYDDVEPPVALR